MYTYYINFFCRTNSPRNSYSSDSVRRKYRLNGNRKKYVNQRKCESPKPNKTSKGRVVQVNYIYYI